MPSFARISAVYREYLTFLEYPTIVTSLPSFMILALPIGSTKSSLNTSSGTSKAYPYKFSFSKKTTGLSPLTAALSKPLQSSAS